MKTAILYSGSIRTLASTIENNINYFQDYHNKSDLYFSVWDHVGYADKINSPDYINSNRVVLPSTIVNEDLIRRLVPKGINIKAIKIEKYIPENYQMALVNGIDNPNLSAQYYKMWDCFNLLDDSHYDVYVRLRCDILLNNKINVDFLADLCSYERIVFSKKIWYDYIKEPNIQAMNEMIWISNKELMKKACNIYNNTDGINKIISARNQTQINYGESICYMNLEAENMLDNIELFDFNYNILR